jgi:hypothetical protein
MKAKAKAKVDRAGEIVEATKRLLEVILAAWDEPNETEILQDAYDRLKAVCDRGLREGEETEGWLGNCLNQGDAAVAVMELLTCFGEVGPRK